MYGRDAMHVKGMLNCWGVPTNRSHAHSLLPVGFCSSPQVYPWLQRRYSRKLSSTYSTSHRTVCMNIDLLPPLLYFLNRWHGDSILTSPPSFGEKSYSYHQWKNIHGKETTSRPFYCVSHVHILYQNSTKSIFRYRAMPQLIQNKFITAF